MTISEIAKMAGVSKSAVSRYFNDGYISEEKREAIRKVVEETGYYPSLQAQTLRTKKTKMIGVILPRIDSNSIGRVVAGIFSVLGESEYEILLANTMNDNMKELDYLSVFHDKQVDGVILLATIMTAEHKKKLKEMNVPVVIIGQKIAGLPCVYHDDYNAEYDITKMILEKGRRNLVYIGVTQKDKAVGKDRYEGYCKAVREAGFDGLCDRKQIADFSMESGYDAMKKLCEAYDKIDGVIVATDTIAVGAMRYLTDKGIEIPKDIVIAGQGDSVVSRVTTPMLSTIKYYYEDSGKRAAEMMLCLLGGNEPNEKQIKLGYELLDRKSTGQERS